MSAVILDDPRQISALIALQQARGYGFRLPPLRAALAGEICFLEAAPGARVPRRYLTPGSPPTLILLGDDGHAPNGPAGFPQTRRLLAWASALMLHSCGGEERHYEIAVEATRRSRRVVLIETSTAQREAWMALVETEIGRRIKAGRKLLPTLDIQVHPGMPAHPLGVAA